MGIQPSICEQGAKENPMTEVKTCANAACSCIPPEKEKYCSPHCEGMDDKVEVLCGCGHVSCTGVFASQAIPETAVEYVEDLALGAPAIEYPSEPSAI
jgi:hypothetical protein